MLNMDLEYNKGILFVRLKGNLNRRSSYKLNNYLLPVLVYNLYELENVDEAGIDAILNTKCAIKSNKGKICLCEVSKEIKKLIKRLRIKSVEDERKVFDLIKV